MLIRISQQGRDARSHETGVVCGFGGKVVSANGKEDWSFRGGEGAVFGGGSLIPR